MRKLYESNIFKRVEKSMYKTYLGFAEVLDRDVPFYLRITNDERPDGNIIEFRLGIILESETTKETVSILSRINRKWRYVKFHPREIVQTRNLREIQFTTSDEVPSSWDYKNCIGIIDSSMHYPYIQCYLIGTKYSENLKSLCYTL